MSQVRNLRAMFEGKGDTSPPDRGRASGASTPIQGGTDSPRPLSKVRTNFVAVEKDGRIGLRRDPSHESSVSRRRLSMETDTESVTAAAAAPDKPLVATDDVASRSRAFLNEPIPESPRQAPEPEKGIKKPNKLGAVTDRPSTNPDKHVDEEDSPAPLSPADPTVKPPAPEPQATPTPVAVNGKKKPEKTKEAASAAPTKTAAPAAKKTTTRPGTISTKPGPASKPPAKSPNSVKTPTSATNKPEARISAKPQAKPPVKREPATAAKGGSSITRPTASSASKKPEPIKTSASETGFVKPKPKSPTKPVHLPASLMAPTASSVSKGHAPRQTISRQSNSTQNLNVPGRPPSRASASGATAGKTVKRQTSNINRQRPSLGPPPKKTAQDHPVTKREARVDESFLARMMRPTQASSSKTTEKVPLTPPRKTAKRPSIGDNHNVRRESNAKTPGSVKKPVRKYASATASKEPSVISTEDAHDPAKDKVDNASEGAKEPSTADTSIVEPKEPEPVPEPSVEEVAVDAAKVETAEEAIEIAKEADLVDTFMTSVESAPEFKKNQPASLAELKAEIANTKPEEPSFEPELHKEEEDEEEVETNADKAPEVKAAQPQEPEKPEETGASKDQAADDKVDELADAVKELSFEDKDKNEEAEAVNTEVALDTNIVKDVEKIVDEKVDADVKQDSETVSKEAAATN